LNEWKRSAICHSAVPTDSEQWQYNAHRGVAASLVETLHQFVGRDRVPAVIGMVKYRSF
jgi:hypothetical protein